MVGLLAVPRVVLKVLMLVDSTVDLMVDPMVDLMVDPMVDLMEY